MSKYKFVVESESETKPTKVLVNLVQDRNGVNLCLEGFTILHLGNGGTLHRYILPASLCKYFQLDIIGRVRDTANE